ncbi:MAG: DUF554 domain-containing protein [Phycisphaerales bacterium]|nr:DUF554 domain-containing protein [Phycisphaerales bacterium]
MWAILNGTVINAITVALGSLVGIGFSHRLPDRYQRLVLTALGLVTVTLGVDAGVVGFNDTVARYRPTGDAGRTYGPTLAMVMIGSLIVGCLIGSALRLHDRVEALGGAIHKRFGSGDAARFAEGFLTASVIFCVGPLTLLGCFENGAHGDAGLLMIKSLLDGFCSMALAAGLGWGVFFSVATVLGFQGLLSILAHFFANSIPDLSQQLMNAVGGILLIATALVLLDIKRIPVADMLPGLFLPPLAVAVIESLWPATLITTPGS